MKFKFHNFWDSGDFELISIGFRTFGLLTEEKYEAEIYLFNFGFIVGWGGMSNDG